MSIENWTRRGIGKMYSLSEVMGIPLEEWFEEKHGESRE